MAKWVTLKADKLPFDYRHSPVSVQAFTLENDTDGEPKLEHFVKDDVADYITRNGLGTAGKKKGSTAKSTKSGAKRVRAKGSAAGGFKAAGTGKVRSRTSGKGATKEEIAANAGIDATASALQPDSRLGGTGVAPDGGASDGKPSGNSGS